MKHSTSLRSQIGPGRVVKYKKLSFLHLILHPLISLLMIDRNQCKLKEKIIFVYSRNCGTSLIESRRGLDI